MVAAIDAEKLEKAKKRGRAYQCLRCFYREGKRFIGVKCRIEEHIMKVHLALEEVPFYCKLCLFRCQRKDQLDRHVHAHGRHREMAEKRNIIDNKPCLVENARPHIIGPLDYTVLSPEASLRHFLGLEEAQCSSLSSQPDALEVSGDVVQTVPPAARDVTHTLSRPEVPSFDSGLTSAQTTMTTPKHRIYRNQQVRTPLEQSRNVPVMATCHPSRTGAAPSACLSVAPVLEQQTVAGQLTTFLQSLIGGQQMSLDSSSSGQLRTNIQSSVTVNPGAQPVLPLMSRTPLRSTPVLPVSRDAETMEPMRVDNTGMLPISLGSPKEINLLTDTSQNEKGKAPDASFISLPLPELSIGTPFNSPGQDDPENVLSQLLVDEDMNLETPAKRIAEESEDPLVPTKRPRKDPTSKASTSGSGTDTDKTMVAAVESLSEVIKRNTEAFNKMERSIENNTNVLHKMVEAINRLRNAFEDHEKEERRCEERRKEADIRRDEDRRREYDRRRDDERRRDYGRRISEHQDRDEQRRTDQRRLMEKEGDRADKENNKVRSVLGRVYSNNTISEGTSRR